MSWLSNLFGSKHSYEVEMTVVNPQTDNKYLFYSFIEREPSLHLEAWYKQLKKQNQPIKSEYLSALLQKIETGYFENPLKNIKQHDFDFIAIDFETVNPSRLSACAIGLAYFKSDRLIKTEKHLIKPPSDQRFDSKICKFHGITESHVANEPTFEELWRNHLINQFNETLIVFHNASMDLSVLKQSLNYYEIDEYRFDYLDTMRIAGLAGLPKKLKDLSSHFGIELNDHHNPEIDAKVCGEIFIQLQSIFPDYKEVIDELPQINTSSEKGYGYSVREKFEEKFEEFEEENEEIIEEFRVTEVELEDIQISGSAFLFTGEMNFDREFCKNFIIENGGEIKSGISKKLDYLVLGSSYGWSKVQKLEDYNYNKGGDIRILHEEDFEKLLNKY